MAPRTADPARRASSKVTDVAVQEARGDVDRRDADALHQRAGAALPLPGRHPDAAVEARAERAERLEADLEARLGHAGAAGERALGVLEAQLDEVAVRRHAERAGERAREEPARQPGRRGQLVERRAALQVGVEEIA